MKAKSRKPSCINEHRRCQRRTLNGQCRMPAVDPSGTLCFDHARALDDHTDHSAVLTRFSCGFQTVEGINFALGDLYVLLAQGRISPRRAAVLTYMASLMLRTLPVMHKRFGKYDYRLIGAVKPPRSQHQDEEENDEEEEGQAHQKPIQVVPPAKTPLPATREAFLNAVAQELTTPTGSKPNNQTKEDAHQPATIPTGPNPNPNPSKSEDS